MAIGGYGTVIGIGGGFIAVPLFTLVFHFEPHYAAGTSLIMVLFNTLSGTLAYARQRRIDHYVGLRFAAATIPGAVLGAYLPAFIGLRAFNSILGIALIMVGAFVYHEITHPITTIIRSKGVERRVVDQEGHVYEYRVNMRQGLTLSVVTGVVSSALGVGGGIIHVPAMIALLGIPVRISVATSHFILLITVTAGALSHASLQNVRYEFAVPLGIGAVVGAQMGAAIAHRLRGRAIQTIVSLTLLGLGVITLISGLAP